MTIYETSICMPRCIYMYRLPGRTEYNAEYNADYNAEYNADYNADYNAEYNAISVSKLHY